MGNEKPTDSFETSGLRVTAYFLIELKHLNPPAVRGQKSQTGKAQVELFHRVETKSKRLFCQSPATHPE